MAAVEIGSFDSPDEIRKFEGKGHTAIVTVAGRNIARARFTNSDTPTTMIPTATSFSPGVVGTRSP